MWMELRWFYKSSYPEFVWEIEYLSLFANNTKHLNILHKPRCTHNNDYHMIVVKTCLYEKLLGFNK